MLLIKFSDRDPSRANLPFATNFQSSLVKQNALNLNFTLTRPLDALTTEKATFAYKRDFHGHCCCFDLE